VEDHREITEAPLKQVANLERQVLLLQGQVMSLRIKNATLQLQMESDREEEHF
jgi:hypothetical protein